MSVNINIADSLFENVRICKRQKNTDVTTKAAFKSDDSVDLLLYVPRGIGAYKACLCANIDQGQSFCCEFSFDDIDENCDVYKVSLDFTKLFPSGDGLMFWHAELLTHEGTVYVYSLNNVDAFCDYQQNKKEFRVLVYNKDFYTPSFAKEAVMYQIFVDRFFKGNVNVPIRKDAKVEDDWCHGTVEYSHYGEPIENNTHFGGTLYGVSEKLDYLQNLGVGILYLNPIFEAYSNHKYDTGDYEKVDSMFGGDDAFDYLVLQMKDRNMHLLLDGVFNHTGSDSKYFNKKGKYKTIGAYQSKESEYFDWYKFYEYPDNYKSWWGIDVLPTIDGKNENVREYFLSRDGIVRKWLRRGACGFRLDVADELDDEFLTLLKKAARLENKESLIIGEVWENAADKISYGKRRNYFRGHQLDSVMNYPIKDAIISFVKFADADGFYNVVTDIYSSTPDVCSCCMMNILSSHDTPRIITCLAGKSSDGLSKDELSAITLTKEQYEQGKKMLFLASVLQFTLPGIPCIYYGDEIGMQGYGDPFCRMPFRWGFEDYEILSHYKKLCKIKKNEKSLHKADMEFVRYNDGVVIFRRGNITVVANATNEKKEFEISQMYSDLLCDKTCKDSVFVDACSAKILKKTAESF